jgi:hypothetical protein
VSQQEKRKEMLAQALRDYPTWGDAYIAEKQRVEELSRVLLDVDGTLLAYWTDIPEAEVEQFRVLIRETLGDYEPSAAGSQESPSKELYPPINYQVGAIDMGGDSPNVPGDKTTSDREPDPWPIIYWLRTNFPRALESCPYKIGAAGALQVPGRPDDPRAEASQSRGDS